MANETLTPDGNTRNIAGAVTDDSNAFIKKLRIDDTTKGLKVLVVGGTGTGTLTTVEDGITTVANATTIDFTSGAVVTNLGGGVAGVAISGSSGITIGTTTITSGTNTRILYDNAGVVGEYTLTGSGTVVAMATSPTFQTSINGAYLTASQILITDGSSNIVSAPVVTYPSLTELSYVKGVTSAIQTQINAKGTGTVTAVSVATANGFSGTVANATTTPAITIIAGAITPTSVNGLTLASQAVGFTIAGGTTSKTLTVPLDASVSGTNTGDQTLTIAGTTSPTIALSGSNTATFAGATGITLGQTGGTITITGPSLSGYALIGQTMYIGTTAVAINRTTGALALTGITSIDGTATNLSGTPALPNGTTATTQSANNNSTKLATTAYVDAQPASALKSATTTVNVSSATAPTNGQVLTATSGTAATWQTPSGGTSFIPQEFLFSSGTTLYSANGGLVYAFDASGNLFVAIVNGTTTCTLYRYGKTSIGTYNFTNSTTLTITSGTYVGIVVIGSYLYVNCSISSTGALCRYNIADLTGVTTMTVLSSNVYGLQGGVPPYAFNDGTGTNIYVGYGGQSYFYMATISGTTVTYNSQITYTSLPFSLGCAVANGSYMWMISGGNVLKWAITGGAEVSSTPCSTYLANGLNLYSGTILEVVSTFNYYTGTTVTGIGIKLNAMPLP